MAKNDDETDDNEEDNKSAKHSNASSTKTTSKSTTIVSSTKKKKISGWEISAIILVILIVVVLILYLLYGSLFVSLLSVAFSNVPLSGQTIKSILLQKIDRLPVLATTYAGTISLNGKDPNIQISYFKYYNDTRITYALENISFIGSGDITIINSTNDSSKDEICVPTSLALFNSTQISKAATYFCANSNSANYSELSNKINGVLDVSSISNVHLNSYGLGFEDWQLCYKIAGSGNMKFNRQLIREQGIVNSTVNFNSCVSAQYGIPIKLSGTINFQDASGSNDTLGFNLTQINMNQSATESQVLQLPIGTS